MDTCMISRVCFTRKTTPSVSLPPLEYVNTGYHSSHLPITTALQMNYYRITTELLPNYN